MLILTIVHLLVAILLITVILLQQQGSGISATFGGGGEQFRSRRSVEKLLIYATIILAILFGAISIVLLLPLK